MTVTASVAPVNSPALVVGLVSLLGVNAWAGACPKNDAKCIKALPLWRELAMARSQLDEAWFDAHVKVLSASTRKWNSGTSLEVNYELSIDWLKMKHRDDVIVVVDRKESATYGLDLPRGVQLDKAQMAQAVEKGAYATSISVIPRVETLKFKSQDEALAALRALPDGSRLQAGQVVFYRPGVVPHENGHPHLLASGSGPAIDHCVDAMIDLVTGETHLQANACQMTGTGQVPGNTGVVGPRGQRP